MMQLYYWKLVGGVDTGGQPRYSAVGPSYPFTACPVDYQGNENFYQCNWKTYSLLTLCSVAVRGSVCCACVFSWVLEASSQRWSWWSGAWVIVSLVHCTTSTGCRNCSISGLVRYSGQAGWWSGGSLSACRWTSLLVDISEGILSDTM